MDSDQLMLLTKATQNTPEQPLDTAAGILQI